MIEIVQRWNLRAFIVANLIFVTILVVWQEEYHPQLLMFRFINAIIFFSITISILSLINRYVKMPSLLFWCTILFLGILPQVIDMLNPENVVYYGDSQGGLIANGSYTERGMALKFNELIAHLTATIIAIISYLSMVNKPKK